MYMNKLFLQPYSYLMQKTANKVGQDLATEDVKYVMYQVQNVLQRHQVIKEEKNKGQTKYEKINSECCRNKSNSEQ